MCQESGRPGMRRVTSVARALFAMLALLASLAPVSTASCPETLGDTGPEVIVKQMLMDTVRKLGWPAKISPRPGLPGHSWQITADGSDLQPALTAVVSISPENEQPAWLDKLESQGLTRGLYHGCEAIIVRSGDRLCADEDPMGEADLHGATSCQETHGLIAWRCGPYSFLAEDTTGSGRELEVAEALYGAAQQHRLCGLTSSTVVILAQTADTPGTTPLSHFRAVAQAANDYYRLNGYGRVDFTFSFMDADGDQGSRDWYTVGPVLSSYAGNPYDYAVTALQTAFAGANLPSVVYLERAIIVYAGQAWQADPTRPLSSSRCLLAASHAIELTATGHKTSIYVPNLILVSEKDALGTWVHELGHTLHARHGISQATEQLHDRYSDPDAPMQGGEVGYWDLMGRGNRWGNPAGSSPAHMSSYTKVAAGWLRYRRAVLDRDYVLTSLENQSMGDTVLTVDDPDSDDPRDYYILEARDSDGPFAAPRSGLVIYRVACDPRGGYEIVEIVHCPNNNTTIILGGLVVKLVAESFSPYKATIRLSH